MGAREMDRTRKEKPNQATISTVFGAITSTIFTEKRVMHQVGDG